MSDRDEITIEAKQQVKGNVRIRKALESLFGTTKVKGVERGDLIPPKYDPESLYTIYENSAHLVPNISAMEANIDGTGFRIKPSVDLPEDARDQWGKLIWEDLLLRGKIEENQAFSNWYEEQDPDWLDEQISRYRFLMDVQRARAKAFFRNVGGSISFIELRRKHRVDLEVTGNAYWEVIRDTKGRIVEFVRIDPTRVLISRLSKDPVPVKQYRRVSDLTVEEEIVDRRVRVYAVDVNGELRFLKPLGVQAIVSSKTGKLFVDPQQWERWKKDNPDDVEGNEIVHFAINQTNSPYGVPRWIGATPEVVGSRLASEYNFGYFTEGLLDNMILAVNGGTLSPESKTRIKEFFEDLKGVGGAHKLLIIEATSNLGEKVPQIELKPIKQKETTDAAWLKYDEANSDKIGSMFRLPRIIRGITQGTYNRATAQSALKQADEQVFSLERRAFDWWVNHYVLPEIGCHLVEFVSNGVETNDIETVGALVAKFAQYGIITPNEGRQLIERLLAVELPDISEQTWVHYPLQMVLAGLVDVSGDVWSTEEGEGTGNASKTLQGRIKDELRRAFHELMQSKAREEIGEEARRLLDELDNALTGSKGGEDV